MPEVTTPTTSNPTSTRATARDVATRLADHAIRASEAYGRSDLADRVREVRERVVDPTVRVLVIGEFKQGKSSLVNALVGRDVCPVDDDVATAVATAVKYAPEVVAHAIVRFVDDEHDSVLRSRRIAVDALPKWVTEGGNEVVARDVQLVEVGVPVDSLRDGLVMVDLPGVGGLGSIQGAMTLAALSSAQGVVFVSDCAQELTATEFDFLHSVTSQCAMTCLVESKTDIHPAWRHVVNADTAIVADLVSGPFPVSSELARKARESDDRALATESGIEAVVRWLHGDVVVGSARRDAGLVADVAGAVGEQLTAPFRAELEMLTQPENAAALAERLEGAQRELDAVRGSAARWQTVFADAFTDLSNDLEHDLRIRIRAVVREAENALDQLDPAKSWELYEPQVRRDVARVLGDHYIALDTRVAEVARAVAAVFVADTDALDAWVGEVTDRDDAGLGSSEPNPDEPLGPQEARRPGLVAQALTLLRSSYGGAAMTGFIATAIGFPIAAPAVLAVGIALGAKGLRQENQRQLVQRRAQAKATVRAFVDEASIVVAKDSRDRVRQAQRHLRDFFTARAEELAHSAAEALQAARQAAQSDAQDRDRRQRDIEAELERLAWLGQVAAETRAAVVSGASP